MKLKTNYDKVSFKKIGIISFILSQLEKPVTSAKQGVAPVSYAIES